MAAIVQLNMADVGKCKALTSRGYECESNIKEDGLCGVHLRSRKMKGVTAFEFGQLANKYTKDRTELRDSYNVRMDEVQYLPGGGEMVRQLMGELARKTAEVDAEYENARRLVIPRVTAMMVANPDLRKEQEDADERERAKRELAAQRRRERAEAFRQQRLAEIERDRAIAMERERLAQELARRQRADALELIARLQMEADIGADWRVEAVELDLPPPRDAPAHVWGGAEGVVFAPAAPPQRDLGMIARDPQNIHTSEVVKHTKEIVAKVREIPVPEGYRWDPEICSKTPGEIIAECRLTQKAAHQMMSQYALDTAIYDIEPGIYGKVLDSMWQFVKGHAEKDSLIAIIRTELMDGVGMCAQGNLTRVCNILSGYLDGVEFKESIAEKMGRLLPPLREIESAIDRITRAREILNENGVPKDEQDIWLDAVMG